ncbi:MAG: HDOD domain-containing protein [Thermodesulfovibrionales bacterium]
MQERLVDKLFSKLTDIPTLPSIVLQINKIIKNDNISTYDIGSIIERDPSLTSKVLKFANSSYYGLSYSVNTVTRAITVLGINTIRNIALTASVFEIFNSKKSLPFDIAGLWYHSLGCAMASKAFISKAAHLLEEEAFICGILHDIGKVIIAQNMPDLMNRVLDEIKKGKSQSDAEKDIIGYTHSEVGALLSEKWHLPEELCETIRFHHCPQYLDESKSLKGHPFLLYAVYAGNQISKALALGKSTDLIVSEIDPITWSTLYISESELREILFSIKMDFDLMLESWKLV